MKNPICPGAQCVLTILCFAATHLIAGAATAQEASPGEAGVSLDLNVVAKQLDIARSEIQPSLGATVYDFSRQAIETQPQGDNQPFNRLLLQAPGVSQDSFGQLHVRNEHANTQFRINGVQLPEGINVFGQALQTRLANSVALITGSLPAQYGCAPLVLSTSRPRLEPSLQAVPRRCTAARSRRSSPAPNGMAPLVKWITTSLANICKMPRGSKTRRRPGTRSTTIPSSHAALPTSPASSIRRAG